MKGKSVVNGVWVAMVVVALLASGCASNGKQESDAYRAATDVNFAASAWINNHDYHKAVYGIERALEEYEGETFDQSALTVLALVHLERGAHDNFLETAQRLEQLVEERELISRQTQHVLLVAAAMNEQPRSSLPGRGYDPAHSRSVYGLLEVEGK